RSPGCGRLDEAGAPASSSRPHPGDRHARSCTMPSIALEELPMAALPPLRYVDALPASADLVVIGGGIVGAATAFFASRAGLSTVIVEKRRALCTLTTPVSTGAFRLQFDNPDEIALVREGVSLFERFSEVADLPGYDIGLKQQGYLFCTTEETGVNRQREWVSMQHGWGLDDVEILPGDEVRYRFPHIGPAVLQARYRAKDGWLKPKALTMGYARASGAAICLDTAATGFVRAGDRVVGVQTARGTISCQHVVLAAGPFSGIVAGWAGLDLGMQPRRRMKLVIPELPEIPPDAPMTIDEETIAHWRPALNGAYALFTDPTAPPTEPRDNVTPDATFAFDLLSPDSPRSLARISPLWQQVWERGEPDWVLQAGQYEYTPDHKPYLGPSAVPGLALNCGYSGHGIMASAGGSRLTVDALLGKVQAGENPFRPDREIVERPFDIL
ncbi:MAG: FAD-binding oxidoreductase, partial [Chloroflexi bacterium]|nr:FAD-binding oxidoreductase [Chloroflexota bacterium]